jgi:uncharacterized membrane protein
MTTKVPGFKPQDLQNGIRSPSFVVGLLALLCSPNAWSQVENFATIDVPNSTLTRATDINNLGVVVGRFDDANGVHGFVLDHGVFTTVDYPGAHTTTLLGINDLGDVCGRFVQGGLDRGFVLKGGTFTPIDVPGAVHTQCHGINTQGQVVGRYFSWENPGQGGGTGRQVEHGFLLSNGVYTSVDYPQANTTDAWKIRDDGMIVGDWSTNGALNSGSVHGYVLAGGHFTSIDVPGSVITASREVNSHGVMVGIYWDKKSNDHGFVRAGRLFGSFDYPGSVETDGNAINDRGRIVGSYWDAAGKEHGYIAQLEDN